MDTITQNPAEVMRQGVEEVRRAKRDQHVFHDWFYVQEIRMQERERLLHEGVDPASPLGQARLLCNVAERMPLSILPGAMLAGSQDCAFSPSYALINPSFRIESFGGYCDPTALYDDVSPDLEAGLTAERIADVRDYWESTPYVRQLKEIYQQHRQAISEVTFFMEPVTGHIIPDMRPFLRYGVKARQQAALELGEYGIAMAEALKAPLILARRYRQLALAKAERSDPETAERLRGIADTLLNIPAHPARNFREAAQSYALLWQTMVLEQAPNPYACSAGNLDRVLAPYYDPRRESRAEATELLRHLLCFFQVGDRCWAISQNVLVGGRDSEGQDATTPLTEILLDAFNVSNDPQPALSVRVHEDTPDDLWRNLGRFFFTPGHSTPSLFNDDSLVPMLMNNGVSGEDCVDYAIAGCQEPSIMGRSNLNTTNTWLNLAKVLELALNDGRSLLTSKQLGPTWKELGWTDASSAWYNLEKVFFAYLEHFLPQMAEAGNACTKLLGRELPVPLTSALMDSFASERDLRDPERPGCRYHGAGCLVHGLSVVADSLAAVDRALDTDLWSVEEMRTALQQDFSYNEDMQTFLSSQAKWGNDEDEVDEIATRLVREVSNQIRSLRTTAATAYLADWSTPSTHLLYGHWVGATPDGRRARSMLGYGIDPRPATLRTDLPERIAAAWKLPFHEMNGGYASHIGVSPAEAVGKTATEKGIWLRNRVINPLFRLGEGVAKAPYYVYFNIESPKHLEEVLKQPEIHAPSGMYIMRIHGTFVNFLDLSPAIQRDIILRLDANRTGN